MVAAETTTAEATAETNNGRDNNVIPDLVMVLMVLKVTMVLKN